MASPDNTTGAGMPTDYGVWSTGDFNAADQIVACAAQRNLIDPARIHALGFSAGGLAAGTMYWQRSNYLASVVTYSGGTSPWPGNSLAQNRSNKAAYMGFHGGSGDWVVLSFQDQTQDMARRVAASGAPAFVCNHNGGHLIPGQGPRAAWEFFKAHPYGTGTSPWSGGVPPGVPAFCRPFR